MRLATGATTMGDETEQTVKDGRHPRLARDREYRMSGSPTMAAGLSTAGVYGDKGENRQSTQVPWVRRPGGRSDWRMSTRVRRQSAGMGVRGRTGAGLQVAILRMMDTYLGVGV